MAQRRRAVLSTGPTGGTAEEMARRATGRRIPGVSRLAGGRLKMVGAAHDKRVGMVLPHELAEAWAAQAEAEGVSKTDLFEDMLLRHLKRKGWELGQ